MTSPQRIATAAGAEVPNRLLEVIATLAHEARPHAGRPARVDWDSRFDQDLGLDSLARAELLARVGRTFGVALPDAALYAETPRALLDQLLAAQPTAASNQERYPLPERVQGNPDNARSLLDVLDWHMTHHPQRPHLFIYETDVPEQLNFADLDTGADAVAAGLRERGLRPQEPVALMLPTGRDYFFAFFGILKAGGVPLPIYPPARPAQLEDHLRRHARILANAVSRWLIVSNDMLRLAGLLRIEGVGLENILTVGELGSLATQRQVQPAAEDLALLQYTSGSTGDPKGVMLTHANLLANIRAIGERIGATSDDVFVSWLPLYHDMGLIGAWLGSLYFSLPLVVMPPQSFLAHPSRWLWMIHRHRGTLSASPNFGYELCLRHLDAVDSEGLDLGSWRYAFNGAEPVSTATLERFCARFAPHGFRREALAPVYGLAENSVGLTMPHPGRGAVTDWVRREEFMRHGRAEPATPADAVLQFVGCGPVLRGHAIRVVDRNRRELPDRQEGQIEFRGPSATTGYYNNPAASRRLIRDGWLDTGDRGYLVAGELFITGREKDLIIRGGRNIHPYELEEAVGALPGVRKGCVAVFGSRDADTGEERMIVVAETRDTDPASLQSLRRQIERRTTQLMDVAADDVRLVPPHSVLKTSSGKIGRAATRDLYQHGQLGHRPRAVWRQALRLRLASLAQQLRQRTAGWGQMLYAAYAWTVFATGGLLVWLVVALLPGVDRRWRFVRTALGPMIRLAGLRVDGKGAHHVPPTGPCIVVSNHASYLDSLALGRVLPRPFRFVAKAELRRSFFARVLLERLGTLFVERFDLTASLADAARIGEALRTGSAVVFFPEGTLRREPGLHGFHMGAFAAAAEHGVPVVPTVIRGSRFVLLADSWLPRRGEVEVLIAAPMRPQGADWAAAVALRDQARAAMLATLGEPDLDSEG